MRGLSFWVLCLLLSAVAASAQSLGEVAKKEKERREHIDKSERASVITEADLNEGEDGRGEDSPTDVGADGKSSGGRSVRRPKVPDLVLSGSEPASTENVLVTDHWDDSFAEYQKAYREAKAYLNFAEAFQRHCKDGTPPPRMPHIPGGYWMVNCDSFPDDIADARRAMKQIQDECYNEARRLGVLPGRARLR